MLQNAYFVAKIGADTAENEQHSAEILPKTGNYPTGPNAVTGCSTAAAPSWGPLPSFPIAGLVRPMQPRTKIWARNEEYKQ